MGRETAPFLEKAISKLIQSYGYGKEKPPKHIRNKVTGKTFVAQNVFLPSNISNLKLWCRFNTGITEVTGVSNWADQSGSGNDLAQATEANQPANSSGIITFDNSNDLLQATFTLTQPTTMFGILRPNAWTSGDVLFDGKTNTSNILQQITSTPNVRAFAGSGSTESTSLTLNSFHVVVIVFNGASSELYIDSDSAITGNFGSSDAAGITLGASGAGANPANVSFKEFGAYSVALNSTQVTQIKDYLNTVDGGGYF